MFQIFTISTFLFTLRVLPVYGVKFRSIGDLLRVACSSKFSSSGSIFQWMVLLSSTTHIPKAMIDAVKHMECDYETRTIESLPLWNTSETLNSLDYKVIAIGLSMEDLRRGLAVYVSLVPPSSNGYFVGVCYAANSCVVSQTPLKHHVSVWCTWSFRNLDLFKDSIEIDFDFHCCQGLLFARENERNHDPFLLEVYELGKPISISLQRLARRRSTQYSSSMIAGILGNRGRV